MQRMQDMHYRAFALARGALEADPGLFPASDLVLSLARTTGQRDLIALELDRAMAIWPNRQSLILSVAGMTPNWGGPAGWGPRACARYAARIADMPDYTAQFCEVDIRFAAPYPRADRVRANDRLADLDHPALDPARARPRPRSSPPALDPARARPRPRSTPPAARRPCRG